MGHGNGMKFNPTIVSVDFVYIQPITPSTTANNILQLQFKSLQP